MKSGVAEIRTTVADPDREIVVGNCMTLTVVEGLGHMIGDQDHASDDPNHVIGGQGHANEGRVQGHVVEVLENGGSYVYIFGLVGCR